jgi:hypothetical protein
VNSKEISNIEKKLDEIVSLLASQSPKEKYVYYRIHSKDRAGYDCFDVETGEKIGFESYTGKFEPEDVPKC